MRGGGGSLPARTKGVMDRALLPSSGFRFNDDFPVSRKIADRSHSRCDGNVGYTRLVRQNYVLSRYAHLHHITSTRFLWYSTKTKRDRHIAAVEATSEEEIQRWLAQARADSVAAAKRSAAKVLVIATPSAQ